MSWSAAGDPVRGEVVSTNASGGVAATLYDAGATAGTARTQTADEFATVTDLIFISTDGGKYDLVFYPLGGAIADGAGLRIAKGIADAHGGLAHHFETPVIGPRGYGVALIADSGQVDLVVVGNLSK